MKKDHTRLDQSRAPIYEALETFRQMRVVPFDVPGHKRGRGNPELTAFLGQQCVGVDVNSMKPLDNLCHPVSVIQEAEELAADAFGAAHAFLMVGGTTSSVQSMYRALCCTGFARVDLFYTPDGRTVFNEVNTIPGFTEHSRFPGMMRGAGVEFGPLVERLLEQAVADV